MPDFAANVSTLFRPLPLPDRFAAAARYGFDAVELASPYAFPWQELAERLREERVALVIFDLVDDARGDDGRDVATNPERVQEFRENVQRARAYARGLRCLYLACPAPLPEPGTTTEQMRQTLIGNLRYAADATRPIGVRILLEPVGADSVPGSHDAPPARAISLLDATGVRNIALLYDVARMRSIGQPISATIARHLPRIGHIRIPCPRQAPPMGECDDDGLIAFLDDVGYRGWIGCAHDTDDERTALAWLSRHMATTARDLVWGVPKSALRLP